MQEKFQSIEQNEQVRLNKWIEKIKKFAGNRELFFSTIKIDWNNYIVISKKNWEITSFSDADWNLVAYKWETEDMYWLLIKKFNLDENQILRLSKENPKQLFEIYREITVIYQRSDILTMIAQKDRVESENLNYESLINDKCFTLLDYAIFKSKNMFNDKSFENILNKKKEEFKEWIEKWYDKVWVVILPLSKLQEYALAKWDWKKQQEITTQYWKLDIQHKIITKEDIDFILKQWLINEEEANEYNRLIELRDAKKASLSEFDNLKNQVA